MKRNLLFFTIIPVCILLACKPFVSSSPPATAAPVIPMQPVQPTAAIPPAAEIPTSAASNPTPAIIVTDVTNTHWVGRSYDQDNNNVWQVFEIIFLPGGKLRYYTPNDWRENGTWQQNGDDITLEWGNHACDLYGVLYGDVILGAKQCASGLTQGWSVQYTVP